MADHTEMSAYYDLQYRQQITALPDGFATHSSPDGCGVDHTAPPTGSLHDDAAPLFLEFCKR